jgi:hypothetical protein
MICNGNHAKNWLYLRLVQQEETETINMKLFGGITC